MGANGNGVSAASERDPVEALAEEFVARHRRGESPSVTEYAERYPELAGQIRETFPAALMLERLKPAPADLSSGGTSGTSVRTPQRLGDYRILREVGRGGMGVVYEAEQVSLGRRVALKVLPSHPSLDPRLLRRFELEARAAARLHHTNIVPVFGVGEENGVHYYVMQFIHGQGLDAVLEELRRLRRVSRGPAPARDVPPETATATDVAEFLRSGGPRAITADVTGGGSPPAARDASAVSLTSNGSQPYWSHVASVGVQVAEALQYAHEAGILHRDVKPSNLMLDTRGRVWVTDFGLAKLDDQPDLTRESDVIGTLRYMAPERFAGTCDAGSDVYGLGLVLYELLTLRPAFGASSRHELVEQITGRGCPPPRSADRRVPRDLETVVLKAAAQDPAERYATAGALAHDLRRFLEDKPVAARRISGMDRLRRWCRRNPVSAGLAACVLGLLIALTIGSAAAAARFQRLAYQRSEAYGQADTARRLAEATLLELYPASAAAAARRGQDAEAALWYANAALLAPAGSEEATRNATAASLWTRGGPTPIAAFTIPGTKVEELRFEPDGRRLLVRGNVGANAAVDVTLWDVATGQQIQLPAGHVDAAPAPPLPTDLQLSPDGKSPIWVVTDAAGRRVAAAVGDQVRVFDVGTRKQIATIPLPRNTASRGAVSPDGMTLLVTYPSRAADWWSLSSGGRVTPELESLAGVERAAFCPAGRLLATSGPGNLVRAWSLPAPALPVKRIPVDGNYAAVRFDRSGRYVMASGLGANIGSLRSTQVYDTETAAPAGPPLIPDGNIRAADFSVDGRHVATACTSEDGHSLQFWDWRSGERAGASVSLPSEPLGCEYDPTGTRLAVRCLGGEVLVVDPSGGAVAVRFDAAALSRDVQWIVQHGGVRWSGDGRSLVTWGGAAAQVWDPATGTERYPPLQHGSVCSDTALSPGGEFLASAAWDGSVRVWEFATGRPASAPLVHGVASHSVWFLPDGHHLLTGCTDNTIRLWDWRAGRMVQPVSDEGYSYSTQASPDGRWLLCGTTERSVRLWDVARRQPLTPAIPVGGDPWTAEFAPNGRVVAVSGSGASIDLVRLDELHAPVPPPPQRALAWAELVAGQRLDRGTPARLTGEEWLRRWREIGSTASKGSAADASWHRTQVVAARAAGDAAAELFHLKKLSSSGAADWGEAARAAYLYGVRREWRDAAENSAAAVRLRPTDARLHVFHGDALAAAGDAAGAEAAYREALRLRPAQQGWVRGNWWIAGPFSGGIAAAGPGEVSDDSKWRPLDHDRPALVFHDRFDWAEHVTGYARTVVYCDRDERTVTLVLGSDDGVGLWLNGQEVFRHDGYITPGDRKVEVKLKKGFNTLLAAVANERRHHSLYVRILD